ncbi:ATP-dependent Clp protease proteolytic subunit [bacterium (Candidatus Gribaldobacteria) CG_4_10_14_0_8_um_filter_33_9]|uniref:ATP-dependent Clp protease proteolytic subunit n=1 Tax=bacterium (Candidatus Gribaldobacteria) CG_4_10_14_0_8_um_filter_33_9 TaxID=2014266 RepID=A0A2M7RMR3_9BACT|nr:MAG: ATP-dependent Clp protease proteolytic subunit [bacterium (Candidatus Gribaldobacteria) CG_4_10_14_0_8_um_filter_33_9]
MRIVPTIIEKTQRGERASDIFSRLLEERVIFLTGLIDDGLANLVVAEILFLAGRDSTRDIKIYINSPGGVVTAGMAIYDTMQHVDCDISTICVGVAASMGATLLAAGTRGKRFALPNSEILLHQVIIGGISGQATEVEIEARQMLKIREKLNQILMKHTGQPLKKVEEDTDRNFYLSAEQAKEYGIIDEVVKKKK